MQMFSLILCDRFQRSICKWIPSEWSVIWQRYIVSALENLHLTLSPFVWSSTESSHQKLPDFLNYSKVMHSSRPRAMSESGCYPLKVLLSNSFCIFESQSEVGPTVPYAHVVWVPEHSLQDFVEPASPREVPLGECYCCQTQQLTGASQYKLSI